MLPCSSPDGLEACQVCRRCAAIILACQGLLHNLQRDAQIAPSCVVGAFLLRRAAPRASCRAAGSRRRSAIEAIGSAAGECPAAAAPALKGSILAAYKPAGARAVPRGASRHLESQTGQGGGAVSAVRDNLQRRAWAAAYHPRPSPARAGARPLAQPLTPAHPRGRPAQEPARQWRRWRLISSTRSDAHTHSLGDSRRAAARSAPPGMRWE